MKRVERIRLYPTTRQKAALRFILDVTRELYNSLLEERREAYRRRGIIVSSKQQYGELTALRAEDRRVAAVYRECEDAILHRLDLALTAYFRRCKRGEAPGYPRFKARSRWSQIGFSHGNRALRFDSAQKRVIIPGVGPVKLRKGRAVPAFGRAWLVERNGRWYATFECERGVQPLPPTGRVIGVDRGVHVLAALSDGVLFHNRGSSEKRFAATRRLQRALEALTQRDGVGRIRNRTDRQRLCAARRLARAAERAANARRDCAHKVARRIVNATDIIALEKLDLLAMTRTAKGTPDRPGRNVRAKAVLNRRILSSGFGLLRLLIIAKAEEAARLVVEVDPRFSSQECSRCGHVARESRRRRRFACIACGYANHADVNAALVIRGRAQSALKSEPKAGEEPARARQAA